MTDEKGPASPPLDLGAAVAAQLRELRQAAGFSQVRLAREMAARGWPWHQQTVAQVEAAQRVVRLGELADLADLFGITPAAKSAEAAQSAAEQAVRELLIAGLSSGSGHAA